MDLDKELTNKLIGQKVAKIFVSTDNQVTVTIKDESEVLKNSGKFFPFHTRLREIACLSPGSVYEFYYKFYPPSHYCSLHGIVDLLDFFVPSSDRCHEKAFSSSGLHLYLAKSRMEKFKLFKGFENNDFNSGREIRSAIVDCFKYVYEYNVPTKSMAVQDLFHGRRTYFGATVVGPYDTPSINGVVHTLPGIAVAGELKDEETFRDDFIVWLLRNYEAFEYWLSCNQKSKKV